MNTWKLGLLGLLLPILSPATLAADADAGKMKAQPCLACHFADDFVGEAEQDILSLIRATQGPDSRHPPRPVELDENDMADIAAFFARGE